MFSHASKGLKKGINDTFFGNFVGTVKHMTGKGFTLPITVFFSIAPPGDRTQNLRIKSDVFWDSTTASVGVKNNGKTRKC